MFQSICREFLTAFDDVYNTKLVSHDVEIQRNGTRESITATEQKESQFILFIISL